MTSSRAGRKGGTSPPASPRKRILEHPRAAKFYCLPCFRPERLKRHIIVSEHRRFADEADRVKKAAVTDALDAITGPLFMAALGAGYPGDVTKGDILRIAFTAATDPTAAMLAFSHALTTAAPTTPTAVLTVPAAALAFHRLVACVAIRNTSRHFFPLRRVVRVRRIQAAKFRDFPIGPTRPPVPRRLSRQRTAKIHRCRFRGPPTARGTFFLSTPAQSEILIRPGRMI